MSKNGLIIGMLAILGAACNEIDTSTIENYQGAYVLNKGVDATSTISRYNYEDETMENTLFQKKNNGAELGSGASAFAIRRTSDYSNGVGYVVFTDNGEISIIDMDNFNLVGVVTGLTYPNDIVLANEKTAYVSCGNGTSTAEADNVIAKVDLTSNSIVKTFPVKVGPGKMVTSGKFLYVAINGGETKDGNSVEVIDMSNDVVVDTIEVGFQPIDMVVDIDRNIWVYCDGDANGQNQSLYKIYRSFDEEGVITHEAKLNITLGEKANNGVNALTISRDRRFIFYAHGQTFYKSVYKTDEADLEEGESLDADNVAINGEYNDAEFAGIDIDVKTGELNALISNGANTGQFVVFRAGDNQFKFKNSYDVGVNPIFTTYHY